MESRAGVALGLMDRAVTGFTYAVEKLRYLTRQDARIRETTEPLELILALTEANAGTRTSLLGQRLTKLTKAHQERERVEMKRALGMRRQQR